jgi:pimeloyl-ACP methyl ester carboxylesterase
MTLTLEHPSIDRASHPKRYAETVIVSAGAPIVLSIWHGQPGAPTVVFLPGTMTHPLFSREFLDGPVVLLGSSQGGILAMTVAAHNRRLALVAAHNVLDPSLPESLTISRLPGWLVGAYRPLLAALRLATRIAPGLPVPFWAYLDLGRVCGEPESRRRFLTDPLSLHTYPLGFLAELCTADISGMRDGSIGCPVLVIAATGDPLFSFDYPRRVFERIVAPVKELLVFDVDRHLLFNECVELVTDPLVARIRHLVAVPTTAHESARP